MKKILAIGKIAFLVDIYGALITKKQLKYIKSYYFNDESLAEIATQNKVSRAAIQNGIKEGIKELLFYDSKLNLSQKFNIVNEIMQSAKNEELKKKLKLILK